MTRVAAEKLVQSLLGESGALNETCESCKPKHPAPHSRIIENARRNDGGDLLRFHKAYRQSVSRSKSRSRSDIMTEASATTAREPLVVSTIANDEPRGRAFVESSAPRYAPHTDTLADIRAATRRTNGVERQ